MSSMLKVACKVLIKSASLKVNCLEEARFRGSRAEEGWGLTTMKLDLEGDRTVMGARLEPGQEGGSHSILTIRNRSFVLFVFVRNFLCHFLLGIYSN
jgi:hypothetical protein